MSDARRLKPSPSAGEPIAGSARDGMLFAPESLTPLAFTPVYHTLTEPQRLGYNRVHGLYFLEQIIFFEQVMARPTLEWLIRNSPTPQLSREAEHFLQEEDAHSSWFRGLLRDIAPEQYAHGDFRLLDMGSLTHRLMRLPGSSVRFFPAMLWLQLIFEERALYFGRAFVSCGRALDPRFQAVHRQHLEDEPAHIRRDVLFLEWLWPGAPLWLRRVNVRALVWLMREFFLLPKRSGLRVVDTWLREFPELTPRKREFHDAMRALESDDAYLRTLYPKTGFPRTRQLIARWPELAALDDFFTD
ncbi:para-aminobenzoate N-oxygenase AurF [Roseimicrobium gellanilyticum]|uniref:Para-aminobenzoate N-oxygenase AurF n=1 Tax=Roseimicrobium gellanilyticum TaxID=748857 RepID=A0A366HVS9_9BACT|nr:diiron oxygenase [Roseimicrobium gellanilyticum]RBP48010.1 para-aminobenzoate N-oxygenase AurF [Roseimicrobium gellanilyticum]